MKFTKMHGIGNDYVYVNGFAERVDDPSATAVKIADRHFGVGGDGLIMILPPEPGVDAHVRMRMFNADGGESEMCGNGIRCVCKYAHDHGLSKANPMKIQTGRGVLSLNYLTNGDGTVKQVTVDMGEPIFDDTAVPFLVTKLGDLTAKLLSDDAASLIFKDFSHRSGKDFCATRGAWNMKILSMGNPHIVFFVDEVKAIPLERLGPVIECHEAFPRRINVHFAQVHARDEVTMRTWERGSGITLACGTGAAAVCVAGAESGLTDRKILAHLPGGDLTLEWDEKTNHVFKTGPATEVFSGEWTDLVSSH
jgi:diaminopimelate epimerase